MHKGANTGVLVTGDTLLCALRDLTSTGTRS